MQPGTSRCWSCLYLYCCCCFYCHCSCRPTCGDKQHGNNSSSTSSSRSSSYNARLFIHGRSITGIQVCLEDTCLHSVLLFVLLSSERRGYMRRVGESKSKRNMACPVRLIVWVSVQLPADAEAAAHLLFAAAGIACVALFDDLHIVLSEFSAHDAVLALFFVSCCTGRRCESTPMSPRRRQQTAVGRTSMERQWQCINLR